VKIWYRNSLAYDDIVFGHSDVDLTYYSENSLSFAEALEAQAILKRLKILFPHLGELALYDQEKLENFSLVANPIELARDPKLLQKIKTSSGDHEVTTAQKQVFALNWFKNDFHKWKENFESRSRKINRFVKLLQIESDVRPPSNEYELLNILHQTCWQKISDEHFKELISKIMSLPLHSDEKEKALNNFYATNAHLRSLFMACFPQLWIGPSLVHGGRDEDVASYSSLPTDLKNIFKEQIHWEVWGLFGQWMREGGNLNFYVHIDVFLKLLDDIPGDWQRAKRGLKIMKGSDPTHSDSFGADEVHYVSK
jgi:hypothetical protein